MPNGELIAIVDDDLPVRESLRRLMGSVGYTAEVFSLADDFLAFPRLDETACLIGDICMPSMTGLELYQRLVETGTFPYQQFSLRPIRMMLCGPAP